MKNYIHWNIDPEIFNLFGMSIRYYGILFVAGLLLCIYILRWIFRNENISLVKLEKLSTYGLVGIFVGARLGHCLLYEPSYYLGHPLEIILPIQPAAAGGYVFSGYQGLASHGGTVGLLIALIVYSKKTQEPVLRTIDLIAVVAPLGACFIRLANLMNSEIIGIPTNVPWAFVFVRTDGLPRHPAQLYEAMSYLLMFGVMFYLYRRKWKKLQNGFFFGLALSMIFGARFFIEFVKQKQVPFEEHMLLSMGQMLSLPLIALGMVFIVFSFYRNNKMNGRKNDG